MAKTKAHLDAEAAMPPELREAFNELVEDYKEGCRMHVRGGKEFVNYNILGDLIRAGWRKTALP